MQPNNPQVPNQPNDPFAFITNSTQATKPTPLRPTTMKGRIILVSAVAVVLLITFIIVMSILNNASQAKARQYLEISKSQAEIIRLASLAEEKGQSLATKSYAQTIKLSMISSQPDINKLVTSNGIGTKSLNAQLTLSKNTKSDEILNDAEQNKHFDEAFNKIINTELDNYRKLLNASSGGASPSEHEILLNAFDQANIITGVKTT